MMYVKKFYTARGAEVIYSMGQNKILELADEAGAIYRVGQYVLINREILNNYLEQFRVNPAQDPDDEDEDWEDLLEEDE